MQQFAIIVAGGNGTRMGADIPKQFLLLQGIPVLMHTMEQFYKANEDIEIVLVLPEAFKSYWYELCKKHEFDIFHKIVDGGATRFQSVKNGLDFIKKTEGLVAIHDAVRPLVEVSVIQKCFKSAEIFGNGVAAVKIKDSVRQETGEGQTIALDRSMLWAIQTPQTFQLSVIKEAFLQTESPLFTDDATVYEFAGHAVRIVESQYKNFKITTPEDLMLAEVLLGY
jgi:2-C-methyl-D-erythritol 4-phosphate cytidylyltransferase